MFFTETDDDLMMKLATGQQSAFARLFDRHGAQVLGYCCRFTGSQEQGEDVAQEVWMKVIRNASQYQNSGRFTAWLFAIARTSCLNVFRTKWSDIKLDLDDEAAAVTETDRLTLDQELCKKSDLAQLRREIDCLPDAQRAVLLLWMSHESSYDEIASQMSLSVPAVKSLLFRARQNLKHALESSR